MTINVRTARQNELAAWTAAKKIGFNSPEERNQGAFESWEFDLGRVWGSFAGDTVVGTLRGMEAELTVPGGTVRADAVTNVTVTPTHRRRGLLTRMMAAEMAVARERGEPVMGLHAAEWGIYGRFGYGPAAELATTHVDAHRARFTDEPTGSVELVTPEVARDAAAELFDRVRVLTPGAIARPRHWWNVTVGLLRPEGKPEPLDVLYVLGRDAGGAVTGYAAYRIPGKDWRNERPDNRIEVRDLFGTDLLAEARMWRYLCEHDWVGAVTGDQRRPDEPWRMLLRDARACWQTDRWDGEWIRVLDVPSALAARRYEVPGRLMLRVSDKDGFADGTFALDGGPDGATCTPTTASPDVTLPAATLGALYLGGFGARRAERLGWLSEDEPGAVTRMEAMFRTAIAPWSMTRY